MNREDLRYCARIILLQVGGSILIGYTITLYPVEALVFLLLIIGVVLGTVMYFALAPVKSSDSIVCDHCFNIYAHHPLRSRCSFCGEEHPDSGKLDV